MGVSAEVPTLGSILVTQSPSSWEGLASHLLTLGSSPALPRAVVLVLSVTFQKPRGLCSSCHETIIHQEACISLPAGPQAPLNS